MKAKLALASVLLSISSLSFAQWGGGSSTATPPPSSTGGGNSGGQTLKLVPDVTSGQDRTGAIVAPGYFGGVRVEYVQPFSPFAYAGVEVQDEIVQVNGRPTYDIPSFKQTIAQLFGNVQLTVRDHRNGQFRTIYARL